MKTLVKQHDGARHVWELMVRDFYWTSVALKQLQVGVRSAVGAVSSKRIKLQPFEVVTAAIFARIRPDYEWWVTPNRRDGGIDFVGRGVLLCSRELNIDAAITIGGQCKKRERAANVADELFSSLARMAHNLNPTFFVAAFSSNLSFERIASARSILESSLQRHCHILDRAQIEGLIGANLSAVKPIIDEAFSTSEAQLVLEYFRERSAGPTITVQVSAPRSAMAGESFFIGLTIRRNSVSQDFFRLRWMPHESTDPCPILVSPPGADSASGVSFNFNRASRDDPFVLEQDLEFVSYGVGAQPLGSVHVELLGAQSGIATTTALPAVDILDNLRPPFYDVPYRQALDEIERGYVRARSGKVSCIGVLGAGGAGKTRLCEETCLEARRNGAHVVSARQAHSAEFPRRILANLLLAFAGDNAINQTTVTRVDEILRRLEPRLAKRAKPAIVALCGEAGKAGSLEDDQALLSVFVVLIMERARFQPLVIHLHDLHWCTIDVLDTLDRLIWQLDQVKINRRADRPASGVAVLFLLEGRMHEFREAATTGWSTLVFERFIERLSCPSVVCRAFLPVESSAFAQRLFEQRHTANRLLPESLLQLQQELISAIYHGAGGNPLHMLEQVKLLQQHGILTQNPRTGFVYMLRPDFQRISLPPTVFETIEARWRYYWHHNKQLGLLIWAAALVDDNLPVPLFRHLWSTLAPSVTQGHLESTDFLTIPTVEREGIQVSFRHENYFQTVRRLQVPPDEREKVVEAYGIWFAKRQSLSPGLCYAEARVELEAVHPDIRKVSRILKTARRAAARRHDRALTSRILATLLDSVIWPTDKDKALGGEALIQACDDETVLCESLVRTGRADFAYDRIERTLANVESRLASESLPRSAVDGLRRRRFGLIAIKAGILFHDRRPAEAVAVTTAAVRELEIMDFPGASDEQILWSKVFMEVLDSHGAAVALAGDLPRAVIESRRAAKIAEGLVHAFPDALGVIITYANILLCEAPVESEAILEQYSRSTDSLSESETRLRLGLNLSMARMVVGYQQTTAAAWASCKRLEIAHSSLLAVFKQAHPLGRLADAAAAALLIGLVRVLWNKPDAIDWFSQSASLAIRARQLETLWRAYINLANSLYRGAQPAHDAAAAALDLMEFSLSSYAEPDRSPRFDLLSVPMAHAVRYLILAGDERATKVLTRLPLLRSLFSNVETGELVSDRGGRSSHEWFRIDDVDYVIF